jgi:PAS domain S-box-containing protein
MKVLIVDDTATNRRLLRAVLEAENFAVAEASDGVEALAVLDREAVDAIISDILMPNMDGYRFCEEVRRSDRFHHLPFIIYTSTYNSPADEVLAIRFGADKYIKKPAPIKELTAALAEIMGRAPRSRAGSLAPQQELSLAKLYNETLVSKLEQKIRELSEQAEVLRLSEEKFRQLAESVKEVLWIVSADRSKVLYISPSYEKVWGRSCQSLYDEPLSFTGAIHPEDRAGAIAEITAFERGEQYDLEFRIVRPDGEIRWVHARGKAVRDQKGVIYRLVGIAEDFTARKKAEQQLRQAQKMECIGQLAGGVAHDFNNILTVIGANLELVLMSEENLLPESKDCLAEIAYAANRAVTLNRQLLTFSRSRAMQTQVLDLNELTVSFAKMLRRIVGENIRVQTDLAPKIPPIDADPGMLEQVLMNLSINARDAMPNGGQLSIATRVVAIDQARAETDPRTRAGEFVCLAVEDTGVGIPAENMPRIFEAFFTTKGDGKGTGLGLATVFGIVEQHKGWVDASSEVGVGTAFRIYFPAGSRDPSAPLAPVGQAVRGGSEKILLVEDEGAVRNVILRTLENFGYAVVEADSPVSARRLWSDHNGHFDLLLTDMVMPGGLTGLDLIGLLRAEKPELKVVLTSGYSAELVRGDMDATERIAFLRKPFSTQELGQSVRKCLDGDCGE